MHWNKDAIKNLLLPNLKDIWNETNAYLVSRSGDEERQERLWQRHFSLFTKLLQLFDLHSNSTMEIANYIPDSSIEMEMTPNGMCVRNRNRYISKTGSRFNFKFWFIHFQKTLCEIEITWSMLNESTPIFDKWMVIMILFTIPDMLYIKLCF